MRARKHRHTLSVYKITRAGIYAAVFLALSIIVPSPSEAESFTKNAAGTTGADFLNLGVGARALAMGGAYSSIAEEASGAYWNPAGLVQIAGLSATFMRAAYAADISYNYAAYAQRINEASVLAGSVLMTNIGDITETDISGVERGIFSPRDSVYTLSYGKAIMDFSDSDKDVSIGLSAKYIKSKILNSAEGTGFDLGIMSYNFAAIPYRLAIVMQNLGKGLKFYDHEDPLPLNFRLGGSISAVKNILVSADAIIPKGNTPHAAVGGELNLASDAAQFNLRCGLNSRMLADGLGGISVGVGVSLVLFSVDYAFVPMGELGNTHRISLTIDFPSRVSVFDKKDRTIFTKIPH